MASPKSGFILDILGTRFGSAVEKCLNLAYVKALWAAEPQGYRNWSRKCRCEVGSEVSTFARKQSKLRSFLRGF